MAKGTNAKNLTKAINQLNTTLNKQNKNALSNLTSHANPLVSFGSKITGGTMAGLTAIGGTLGAAISMINKSDNMLQRSLSINKNLEDITKSIPKGDSSRVGLFTAMEAKLEMFEEGIQTNSNGVYQLMLENKALGRDSRVLAKGFRQLSVLGGVTERGQNKLSQVLEETSNKYGIHTDYLVQAMQGLGANLDFAAAGISEQFGGAAAMFAGEFGKSTDQLFNKFMEAFTDPAKMGLQGLTGTFGKIRSVTSPGLTPEQTLSGSKDIIHSVAQQFRQYQQMFGGINSLYATTRANEILGGLGTLADRLDKLDRNKPGDVKLDRFETLGVKMDALTNPLQKLANQLLPKLISGFEWVARILGGIGGGVAGFFAGGPWGAVAGAGAAIAGVEYSISQLNSTIEESTDQQAETARQQKFESDREAANKRREALGISNNEYLSFQSQSLKATLENIIFNGGLQEKLVQLTESQLNSLERVIKAVNSLQPTPKFMPVENN